MRLLFLGDLASTGFGTVTSDLGRELVKLGVDVRFVSQNDTGSTLPEPFLSRTADILTFIQGIDPETGEAAIQEANGLLDGLISGDTKVTLTDKAPWGRWQADAVLMLGDYRAGWMILERSREALASVPTIWYIPVEGNDLPPSWAEAFAIAHPVAMSKFGAKQLGKVVGHPVPMIYHGVDTEQFRPAETRPIVLPNGVTFSTGEECKRSWAFLLAKINGVGRIPKKWLLRTDRNMPRKQYARMLRALAPVLTRNPGWGLVIHCSVFDQGGYLVDSASKYPAIRDRIFFTDTVLERDALVMLYNAADLYVTNSAEGFGLTIAEALACGVPAVGVRYSAVPEVIGPAGVTVDRYSLIDNEYDHYWCAVDEQAFAKEVEALMLADAHREALGAKGPKHVQASFQWSTAARQFVEVLEAEIAQWHPSPPSERFGNISATPEIATSSPRASSAAISS